MKRLISILLIASLINSVSYAQSGKEFGLGGLREPAPAAEYIFKTSSIDKLISVQVLGAVNKPGLYYVPENTDLLKLLTLAGGVSQDTYKEQVQLRRAGPLKLTSKDLNLVSQSGQLLEVNIEELLHKGMPGSISLANNDLVYVPRREPFIGNDLYRTATVISVVLSAVLTGMLISERASK